METIDVMGDGVWSGSYDYTAGTQPDGTWVTPVQARQPQPVDAAGGTAANYAPLVLDVFKFGVGVWNQQQQQQNMLDYKRFEATQLGAFAHGQPALYASSGGQIIGGASGIVLIGAVVLLLMLKG